MAVSLETLLNIKAQVTGSDAVSGLAGKLGSLSAAGDNAGKGLKGLAGSAGGLVSGLKMLVPLASGAGLVAMAKGAIDLGDNMNDLSQKTGVSVEQLSKYKQAAESSGTNIDAVGKALINLSRTMAAAGSGYVDYAAKAKEETAKAVDAVQNGERRQTAALKAEADRRTDALDRETDKRLKALNRRYRNEEQLLNDNYDAAQEAEDKKQQDSIDKIIDGIEAEYKARKKAIQNDKSLSDDQREQMLDSLSKEQEDKVEAIRDGAAKEQKERQKAYRDAKQQDQDAIDDRKQTEETAIKEQIEAQKKAITSAAEQSTEAVKKAAEDRIALLKGTSDDMDELGLNTGKKAAAAFQELGISLNDASGKLKKPNEIFVELFDKFSKYPDETQKARLAIALFKKGGEEMIPMLNMGKKGLEQFNATMSGSFAKDADRANDLLVDLGTKFLKLSMPLAENLIPVLNDITLATIKIFDGFNKLPGPIKALIGYGAAILIAWGPLAGIVTTIASIGGAFGLLITKVPILAGIATVIQVAFTGLVTFLTGTILPAIIAFFSGPVGWTVLAVAAVVAMVVLFKEPIGKFLVWLGQGFTDAVTKLNTFLSAQWTALRTNFKNYVTTPITNGWNAAMQALPNAIKSAGTIINTIWTGIVSGLKSGFAGFINFVNSGLNAAKNAVNFLIKAYNKLPASDIPLIGNIAIPKFAAGGYVTGPTLGMVGEGGQPEYIIPENRMAAASARYLSGARGNALLTAGGGSSFGTGSMQVNITTGPVMEMNGERWVSIEDLERTARQIESAMMQRLRTPSGRRALGVA